MSSSPSNYGERKQTSSCDQTARLPSSSGQNVFSVLTNQPWPLGKDWIERNSERAKGVRCAGALCANFVTDCEKEINRLWAQGGAHTLELAKVVCAFRSMLRRGQWTALWRSGRMPFAKSKADMLLAIGQKLVDLDAQTFGHLPAGWSILYQVAQLERAIFDNLVRAGTIHPKLTLLEAKELVALFNGRRGAKSRTTNVGQRLRRFAEFVRGTVTDWNAAERQLATDELTRLMEQISFAGRIGFG